MDLNPYYIVFAVITITGSILLVAALLVKDMSGLIWYGIGAIGCALLWATFLFRAENNMDRFSNWIYPCAFFALLCVASAVIIRYEHNRRV